MKKPKVSIMIPTYNRKALLVRTLKSLAELNFPKDDYEVIVIDDGSTDGTKGEIDKKKDELPYTLQYHWQENAKLSVARNNAIKHSKGDIIVSIDDDMLFPKDWLKKLIEPLKNPKVGVVGGPPVAPKKLPFLAKCIDYCVTSLIGTGGIRGTTKVKLGKYYPRGGNMAIRKKVLDEVGLFDKTLIPGEDIDLDYRIERAGYKLEYVPNAFVWHLPRTTVKGFVKQIYGRGCSRIKLMKKYKESFELVYLLPALMVISFITLLMLSLFSELFFKILIAAIVFYALFILLISGIVSTITLGNIKALVIVPSLLALQHLTYGIGFLIGFFKK